MRRRCLDLALLRSILKTSEMYLVQFALGKDDNWIEPKVQLYEYLERFDLLVDLGRLSIPDLVATQPRVANSA